MTRPEAKQSSVVPVLLALTLALGACRPASPTRPATAQMPSAMSSDLEGTQWVLTDMDGDSPMEDTRVTLNFTDAQALGSAGCNSYWATYGPSDGSLRLVGIAVTEMACLDPAGVMEQEQRYLDRLRAVVSYVVSGDVLTLETAEGASLTFARSDAPRPTASPVPMVTVPPNLPVSATANPTPPPTPIGGFGYTPTPVSQPEAGPTIHYFRADTAEADPGDTIVLSWSSSGAVEAILYHLPASGQLPASGWNVPPSGSHTYQISADERNLSEFLLHVVAEGGRGSDANLGVALRCPLPWFFQPAPTVCGTAPVHSQAAVEHFERGTMVWVAERDGIFVLYDDGGRPSWDMFIDEWDEGEPADDPNLIPPEGYYQPVRGFGLVWRTNEQVRSRLGWGLDRERGFDTILQSTTLYKYNSTYLSDIDGDVWHLGPERSSWNRIQTVEAP